MHSFSFIPSFIHSVFRWNTFLPYIQMLEQERHPESRLWRELRAILTGWSTTKRRSSPGWITMCFKHITHLSTQLIKTLPHPSQNFLLCPETNLKMRRLRETYEPTDIINQVLMHKSIESCNDKTPAVFFLDSILITLTWTLIWEKWTVYLLFCI